MANPAEATDSNESSRPSAQAAPEAAVLSVFKMTKGCIMLKAKRHVSVFEMCSGRYLNLTFQ